MRNCQATPTRRPSGVNPFRLVLFGDAILVTISAPPFFVARLDFGERAATKFHRLQFATFRWPKHGFPFHVDGSALRGAIKVARRVQRSSASDASGRATRAPNTRVRRHITAPKLRELSPLVLCRQEPA
jgi:hypothetical protein